MATFANVIPNKMTDGVLYADARAMPATEQDLGNQPDDRGPPQPMPYEQALVAAVEFTAGGNVSSNTSYVVLQFDLGDGQWIDIAWCTSTITSGTDLHFLTAGSFTGNSFQQTRASGTAPNPTSGANQCPLAGRFRFVGKGSIGQGAASSPSSAAPAGITVTIRYKLLGLR